ncbi:MAG: 16S rRNA processing protein RimM [Alphaproteobacteria bacterium]|nr:16S rRNA processing protein RimM [Alphaproteobacteria bacterium]
MSFQDQDQPAGRACIGKIADAHGIRGLVKIRLFDIDAALLAEADHVYTNETGDERLSITLKNQSGKYYLAAIEGVEDRNRAEELKGTQLYIEAALVPESDVPDIIGFRVLDDQGKEIGAVIALENFGASDLVEIQPATDKPYYIPLTKDFVPHIDFEGKTITINPITMI